MSERKVFGQMPVAQFLSDYWQKQPYLFRGVWPKLDTGIDINTIAGLAMDENVESRLIEENVAAAPDSAARWTLSHGPFSEGRLSGLPDTHWTLLVQAVDQLLPDVRDWLTTIDFLPSWRVDDIMISIAAPQGTVGPHFDHYDVFLLQAEGTRRWQIGDRATPTTPLVADAPLKILPQFKAKYGWDWVLEPGDVLYVPPLYAHHGVADTTGMTWSFGFRAPEAAELLHGLATRLLVEDNAEFLRYNDADMTAEEASAGSISDSAIARMRRLLEQAIREDALLADFLGSHMTGSKYDLFDPDVALESPPAPDARVRLALPSRITVWQNRLYTNGRVWPLSKGDHRLIDRLLTSDGAWLWGDLESAATSDTATRALAWLWSSGSIEYDDEP